MTPICWLVVGAVGAAVWAFLDAALNAADPAPDNLYWPDPRLGWTLAPGQTRDVALRHQGKTVIRNVLSINPQGFNSPAFQEKKSPGPRRVIVFGDSMVESRHVPPALNLVSRCERALNAGQPPSGPPRYEVWNAGVAGWSADNALDFLRLHGDRYAPDAAIYALFLGNDLIEADYETFRYLFRFAWDCRRYDKPSWALAGGRLVLRNDPARLNHLERLLSVRAYAGSWTYRKLFGRVNDALEKAFNGNLKLKAQGVSYNEFMEKGKGFAHYHGLICALVDRIAQVCRERSCRFGVLLLPNSSLIFPNEAHPSSKKAREYQRDEAHYREILSRLSAKHPVLGLLDALRERQAAGTAVTQAPYDLHFNPPGHALAGEALAGMVRRLFDHGT